MNINKQVYSTSTPTVTVVHSEKVNGNQANPKEYKMEEWRSVPGMPGIKVSNFGRLMRGRKLSKSKPRHNRYHLIGYKGKSYSMHRLIALAFLPNPTNLPHVNHKDLIKSNNCLDNLEWISHGDNVRHAVIARRGSVIGGDVFVGARVPSEHKRALVEWCKANNTTFSAKLVEMLNDFVDHYAFNKKDSNNSNAL